MNNSGSHDAESDRKRSPVLLIVLALVFGLTLIVGFNVLRVLYGVIAPPFPPLPPDMHEVSHESEDYGADVWSYTSASDPCAVVTFYELEGGTCVYSPMQCSQEGLAPYTDFAQTVVASCHGAVSFSIFNMQWWSQIVRNNDSPTLPTTLNLEREVFWIGTGPREAAPSTGS